MFEYKKFSYMLKYDFYFAINLPKKGSLADRMQNLWPVVDKPLYDHVPLYDQHLNTPQAQEHYCLKMHNHSVLTLNCSSVSKQYNLIVKHVQLNSQSMVYGFLF
jgi:hypothetical protein